MLKSHQNSLLFTLILMGLFATFTNSAFADEVSSCWNVQTGGCFSFEDMKETVLRMVNIFVYLLPGTVCLFYLIYAGYLSITAKGNPTQLQKSKETATWAVIGLVIIMSAYLAVNVFSKSFLGGPVQIIGQ